MTPLLGLRSPAFLGGLVSPLAFSELFPGADAAAWNSTNWEVREASNSPTSTLTIQSTQGRQLATGAAYAGVRARAAITAILDVRVTGAFTLDSTSESYANVSVRATDAWDADNYSVPNSSYRMETTSSHITATKDVAGTESEIGTLVWTKTTAKQRFIVEALGTTFRFKVWADGASEPGSWSVSVVDTSVITAGKVTLGFVNGNSTTGRSVLWDDITIGPAIPD